MRIKILIIFFICILSETIKAQTLENNGICTDPIVGAGVYVNGARTAGINFLGGVSTAGNAVDGDLTNYADLQLGVSLLGGGSALSIKDSTLTYPSGNVVGFMIQTEGGILNADVLSDITINLYNDDVLVQSESTSGGLISLGLLSGSNDIHKIGFTSTSDFDEVQIIVSSTLSVLSGFRVYNAFEEPSSCPEVCFDAATASSGASTVGARTGFSGLCVLCSIDNLGNVVSDDTTLFATINQSVGALNNGSISVNVGSLKAAGTEAGFAISPGSGILDLSLLSNVQISTYAAGVLKESYVANNSLITASLLPNSSIQTISFKSSEAFDEVRITVYGAVSLLSTMNVYFAFTATDSDGDGIYDCLDKCVGNDLLDNDGDGQPDACDTDDDNDLITDVDENTIYFTNPFSADSDNDGLSDFDEINGTSPLTTPTNPILADTDGDSIQDGTEVGLIYPNIYTNIAIFIPDSDPSTTTNPLLPDTDGDGFLDGAEDANFNGQVDITESDPNNPCDPNPCAIDLSLYKTVDVSTAAINDNLTYTLTLINAFDSVAATGVMVLDQLPVETQYISHTAFAGTTYDPVSGVWDIADVMTTEDTVILTIFVKVIGSGVISNSAEVIAADQLDIDSTPNNGVIAEDDYATSCTSIPLDICFSDTLVLGVASGYTSYQWNLNGSPISGETSNTLSVFAPGTYTVDINGETGCLTGLCCPFIVTGGVQQLVSIAGTDTLCSGSALNLTASSSTGTIQTYQWKLPNGTISIASTIDISSATMINSGDYILTATFADGCVAIDTFSVLVNQNISIPMLTTTCDNNGTETDGTDDIFTLSVTPSGTIGSTYAVIGNGLDVTGLLIGEPSGPLGSFNIVDGAFNITLTDENSLCSVTTSVSPPANCSSCIVQKCVPILIVKNK